MVTLQVTYEGDGQAAPVVASYSLQGAWQPLQAPPGATAWGRRVVDNLGARAVLVGPHPAESRAIRLLAGQQTTFDRQGALFARVE